jgi:hypothetical protein
MRVFQERPGVGRATAQAVLPLTAARRCPTAASLKSRSISASPMPSKSAGTWIFPCQEAEAMRLLGLRHAQREGPLH